MENVYINLLVFVQASQSLASLLLRSIYPTLASCFQYLASTARFQTLEFTLKLHQSQAGVMFGNGTASRFLVTIVGQVGMGYGLVLPSQKFSS